MLPIQYVDTVVVQANHAIDPIMAGKTLRPKTGLVTAGIGWVFNHMAIETQAFIKT
jgi:hypothetical protein